MEYLLDEHSRSNAPFFGLEKHGAVGDYHGEAARRLHHPRRARRRGNDAAVRAVIAAACKATKSQIKHAEGTATTSCS